MEPVWPDVRRRDAEEAGRALLSRGIGRASALALAKAGPQVLIHYGGGAKEAEAVVAQIRKAGGRANAIAANLAAPDGIGVAIARRWVDQESVDAIVDLANSGVGLAVNSLMHDKNRAMLASATATSDLTGKFCQPTTVQWALDTWALGNAVGRTITKMGGSTWFFISFDYALGKALQRDATEAIVKAGGSVLGSVSHPLGATDFGSYLLQAQASGAKVIALADTGVDAINAIRQAAEFQIVGPDRRLAALFLQITDIDALGLNAAQGLILSEAFYWDLNDQTRAFAARFAERMSGKMPTEDQAAAYSATLAYLRAVKTAGTIEGDKVVAEMKKSPIDDPLFGPVVVRADGRATHAMYVFKVKSPQQSKSRYDVARKIEDFVSWRPGKEGGALEGTPTGDQRIRALYQTSTRRGSSSSVAPDCWIRAASAFKAFEAIECAG